MNPPTQVGRTQAIRNQVRPAEGPDDNSMEAPVMNSVQCDDYKPGRSKGKKK